MIDAVSLRFFGIPLHLCDAKRGKSLTLLRVLLLRGALRDAVAWAGVLRHNHQYEPDDCDQLTPHFLGRNSLYEVDSYQRSIELSRSRLYIS